MKIDRVVSSPAGRAVAAATPIAAHFACPIRFDARLIERGFGPLEGTVYSQLNDEQRRLFDAIYSGDPHVTPPHGESLAAPSPEQQRRCLKPVRRGPVRVRGFSWPVMQAVISTLDGHGAENFPAMRI